MVVGLTMVVVWLTVAVVVSRSVVVLVTVVESVDVVVDNIVVVAVEVLLNIVLKGSTDDDVVLSALQLPAQVSLTLERLMTTHLVWFATGCE